MQDHRSAIGTLVCTTLLLLGPGLASTVAQPKTEETQTLVLQYVGAKACASCHKSKATGNQIEAWQASAHARAYRTLATPEAKAVAQKLGIDTNPQQVPRCLMCHTTAAGEPRSRIAESFDQAEGVQCEACHGPGSEYSKIQHMIKQEAALSLGLRVPDAKSCRKCHNEESPTYKGFDYKTALKAIQHRLAPL